MLLTQIINSRYDYQAFHEQNTYDWMLQRPQNHQRNEWSPEQKKEEPPQKMEVQLGRLWLIVAKRLLMVTPITFFSVTKLYNRKL